MTGSLFSLPETQYINVEHIDLVEERERQLPKDRRPRIQQGFAASLFLPLSLFFGNFWLQMTFLGGGKHILYGSGSLSPGHRATGPSEDLCATFRCFWPCKFCKNHPVARWSGDKPLSPRNRATGIHFCKISKVRSKNVI